MASTPTLPQSVRADKVVRAALRSIRWRYHALPLAERPALDPAGLYGATDREAAILAEHCFWPLPPRVIAWIRRPLNRRLRRSIIAVMAAELPAAIAFLTGGESR